MRATIHYETSFKFLGSAVASKKIGFPVHIHTYALSTWPTLSHKKLVYRSVTKEKINK